MSISRDAATNLISAACQYLDDEDWDAFLDLCDPAFRYRITVRSPEIKREMIWFNQDYAGLRDMFSVIPEHLRRLGTLLRQVSIGHIEQRAPDMAQVTSTFQCIHTDLEGRSNLLAVGRYLDDVRATSGGLRLAARNTVLATRDLGVGSHVPI